MRTRIKRRVRLDRGKYKQVVLNLASNAVKFTPEGGEVELSVEEEEGDTMVTYVRDTGIGIAPENLNVIFDDFQQVESGTTRRFQGIGLGLAIVKRTVELLGGTVTVKSEPGRGTAFCMRFPIRPLGEALVGEQGVDPRMMPRSRTIRSSSPSTTIPKSSRCSAIRSRRRTFAWSGRSTAIAAWSSRAFSSRSRSRSTS